PSLANAIFSIMWFEGRGEGIPTSIEDCQQSGAPIAIVSEHDAYVTVKVFPSQNWSRIGTLAAQVSVARLPITGVNVFGRERVLKQLDEAWGNKNTHVLSLVAWGGV